MGTRNNPKPNDCYDRAEDDEPRFTLIGRDKHAPMLIRLWAEMRRLEGESDEVVSEALTCATQMELFRHARQRRKAVKG